MTLAPVALPVLLVLFVAAAGAVWRAGTALSTTTDVLAARWGWGEALGGLILLAITTNLPEIAITVSAALSQSLGLAIGNILGGIAIQTVVLVLLDALGLGRTSALSYQAASLVLVLEGVLVLAILVLTIMGTQLPSGLSVHGLTPASLLILGTWLAGVWLLRQARTTLPWQERGRAPGVPEPRRVVRAQRAREALQQGHSTRHTAVVFTLAALVTLLAGVVLEESGAVLAAQVRLSGVVFGATILAAVTALPEVATGLTAVRLGDYQLAVSDIFGGNAFLPVLFVLADLLAGHAVLPQAQRSDIYLAGLGMLLTAVYIYGLIFRPARQVGRLGLDSLVVLILYGLGMGGLVAVVQVQG